MNKKILFLSGGENKVYDEKRSLYYNVEVHRIFKRDSLIHRITRRLLLIFLPNHIEVTFGDWKYELNRYDLIILPVSIYSKTILYSIKKKFEIPVVSWYWNPVAKSVLPSCLGTSKEYIFSFDEIDCKKYGLQYKHTYYFKNILLPQHEITKDLVFVGADKGRLEALLYYKDNFEKMGLNVLFHITSSNSRSHSSVYSFKEPIAYDRVLQFISESIGIFDYVQEGQYGMSQRPLEALFFKKKLVTNDVNISEKDFYNSQNIFILSQDNIEDLPTFLNTPYCDVPNEIIDRYDFGSWISAMVKRVFHQ